MFKIWNVKGTAYFVAPIVPAPLSEAVALYTFCAHSRGEKRTLALLL